VVTEVVNLINSNFFIVAIGLIGLFVEALVVSLTGIPYSGTETWEDARTCMILSSLIIAIIIITIILTMIRRRRLERRLPRVPYTLATVIGYIYAARMLESFAGLSVLPTKERNCKIVEIGRGREYGFGWTVGNDEARRVGVDEEELEADYKRQQAIDSKW
jgi:hypothetical protein